VEAAYPVVNRLVAILHLLEHDVSNKGQEPTLISAPKLTASTCAMLFPQDEPGSPASFHVCWDTCQQRLG
jgi:hypothetical protein